MRWKIMIIDAHVHLPTTCNGLSFQKNPELRLVCCHCFYPHLGQCMLAIETQNIFFDISSIADDVSIIPAISNILKRIIEKAPSRVIFGSDYGGCSQRQHIELIKGLHLEKSVEEDIFWNNAVKIYQLQ